MDRLTMMKINKMTTECRVALRKERKTLGFGHSDVKTIIDKLDNDLLGAGTYEEASRLCEFSSNFIIYLHLL